MAFLLKAAELDKLREARALITEVVNDVKPVAGQPRLNTETEKGLKRLDSLKEELNNIIIEGRKNP